jgi:integrase
MTTEHHTLMGGRLHVYRRDNSRYWQCSTFLGGKNRRITTKEESIALAKDIAEDWYLELKGKHKRGEIKDGKLFREAAEKFRNEYETLMEGRRNAQYIKDHVRRINKYLLPFFGDKVLPEITAALVQDYRIDRRKLAMEKWGKPPARQTIHQEIVTLRQILKAANRSGWLPHLPDISDPFRGNEKISHRAWFSLEEYTKLWKATKRRAAHPPKPRWQWSCKQLHDYVLFMANTGLRPDEAARLQFRDVSIVVDDATKETILEIEVRGKRGTGYCKSMPNAVRPFERLRDRERVEIVKEIIEGQARPKITKTLTKPKPTELIFPMTHHELFNIILDEEELKFDREGLRRTSYSLRHTYICFRLLEGADIYQIAKNCRTSVEMIEKFYASHIKSSLDAAAINVRKGGLKRKGKTEASPEDEDI